ncbi:helix-turn-helix domain-containing protein [Mycolicibacterium rufum]|uniref:Helix-turn-helix domain-containing protein n=3 Tax=Mycolicibacterium rufum TaxID=318424 RepID=A0ABY3UGU0_9MYCO|nr:helix-turn-helix domain-containing protein [Mycolicibacterium rufum]ULP36546.1 helix-turn-helix domain-containing protein [Mycolicibacterium rufum]
MTSWKEWAASTVDGIADAVKHRRKHLGLTAADLAARTSVGKPMTRAVISDLETGRKRTLEISELLTLATALELPPLALLFPNVLEDVEVLPGKTLRGIEALGWFTGTGEDTPGDASKIGVALQLVTVERTLEVQRHNLLQHERGPALLDMSEQMKEYSAKNAEHARERISILEAERDRLLGLYERLLEIEETDA